MTTNEALATVEARRTGSGPHENDWDLLEAATTLAVAVHQLIQQSEELQTALDGGVDPRRGC